MPLVHLMQGDPAGARAFIEAQADKLGEPFSMPHVLRMVRTADVLLYEGKGVEALGAGARHLEDAQPHAPVSQSCHARQRAPGARPCGVDGVSGARDPELLRLVARDAAMLKRLGAGFAGFGPAFDRSAGAPSR